MAKRPPEKIVEGITIDRKGTVAVAEGLQQALCAIALDLQDHLPHAVDVEHVLAALVMAVRDGKVSRNQSLPTMGASEITVLQRYINVLFEKYGGDIAEEN